MSLATSQRPNNALQRTLLRRLFTGALRLRQGSSGQVTKVERYGGQARTASLLSLLSLGTLGCGGSKEAKMRACRASGVAIIGLLTWLVGHTGDGSAQELHVISQLPDGAEPLSPPGLSKRIRDAAVQYQAYAPIPRVGFYDIAYPATEAEAKELNRHAVLLVTAICQEKAEIPLRRVYVEVGGRQTDLRRLGSIVSEVRKEDDPVGSTFGQNRVDSLYLIPIYAAAKRGLLLADFAKNRDGFKLGELKGPPSGSIKNWADSPTEGAKPSDKAIKDLIHREYPGFLAE